MWPDDDPCAGSTILTTPGVAGGALDAAGGVAGDTTGAAGAAGSLPPQAMVNTTMDAAAATTENAEGRRRFIRKF